MIPLAALAVLLAQAPAAAPAAAAPVPTGPVVAVETTLGTIKIALYEKESPISCENFLKYVREGYYAGTIFHRVMANFMIQGGGFNPALQEKPGLGPGVRNEARNGLRNLRGTVALARTNDPNSATSQFYINLRTNHTLDFGIMGAGYAVFGQVVEGMKIVDRIANVRTTQIGPHEAVPVNTVIIRSVTQIADRYEPPAEAPAQPAPPAAASGAN
jgi:peptidyl-prolyl cis-trans isomerase A (cyclophilin A)